LYPALDHFRAEFKVVKDALDDPLGSIKKFEGHLYAANKNILTLEKQLDSSSKEICCLQRQIDNLERDIREVMSKYAEEVDEILPSQQDGFDLENERARLEAQINRLESRVEEKDKQITRFLQKNNDPYMSQSPPKKSNPISSAENVTGSDKSKIIDKLSYEEDALFSQLQAAIREKGAMEEKWLDACKSEKILREVFVSNEVHQEKLVNDLEARNQTLANLNHQLQQARSPITHLAPRQSLSVSSTQNNSMTHSSSTHASIPQSGSVASLSTSSTSRSTMTGVSREQAMANLYAHPNDPHTPPRQSSRSISMGNGNHSVASPTNATHHTSAGSPRNVRRASSTATSSRPRPTPTVIQADFINRVRQLRDDQLNHLNDAFEEVRTIQPGDGVHWVKGVSIFLDSHCVKLMCYKHWRRNPGTAVIDNNQDVSRKFFN
jgi:hypothetical protein